MKPGILKDDFLKFTIIVDQYRYSDPRHEIGVVNEYAGIFEFVDSFGNIRITRSNEVVRKFLTDAGYKINYGGSVHQVNFEFVYRMLWEKLEKFYDKGYTCEQVENMLKNDRDLQLALAFCHDDIFRNDVFNTEGCSMSQRDYAALLERNSKYLNGYEYKEKEKLTPEGEKVEDNIFDKIIKPEIYIWLNNKEGKINNQEDTVINVSTKKGKK